MQGPEPSKKSEGVEDFLKGAFGFDRRQVIRDMKCAPEPIGCGKQIATTAEEFPKQFTDELSMKEYAISGLCQQCQDKIFGSED